MTSSLLTSKRVTLLFFVLLTLISFPLGGCEAGSEVGTPPPPTDTEAAPPTSTVIPKTPTPTAPPAAFGIPLSQLSGVQVEFWHVWRYGDRQQGLTNLVRSFNRDNPYGITVTVASYEDIQDAFHTAIQTGELPNALLSYVNILAGWYQNESVIDLAPYLTHSTVGFSEEEREDFYPGVLELGENPAGAQIALPISQSLTTLYYNQTWAKELGFETPPRTSEELLDQACAAAQANALANDPDQQRTGGLVLYPGASNIMGWLYAFGDEGLTTQKTGYHFSTPKAREMGSFLRELWQKGCAFQTESYPNLEFATRQALFTMRSSADIAYQQEAFQAQGARDDAWTLLPFPGPEGKKAVNTLGQTVSIVRSTPEEELATWLFLKYLLDPEAQTAWVKASGYYPVRESVEKQLAGHRSDHPQWASGLELIQYGQAEPVLPSWGAVRWAVFDAFQTIIAGEQVKISVQLEELDTTAAELAAEHDD